jgi:hypothetical protein
VGSTQVTSSLPVTLPVTLQRELQALVAQVQPDPADRPADGELFEDHGDDAGDSLVGMPQDLPVGLAPDQPDRQAAAQLTAGGLVADPAVQAGPEDVELSFGHGALHPEQQPVVEHRRMVDAIGVGDQGVGHPCQIQQPVPIGIVAGQPRALQRQHDPDLSEPDLGRQLREPRSASRGGSRQPQVLIDYAHRTARPPQRLRPRDQVVLTSRRLTVAFDLGERGLTNIDDRDTTQM